MGRKTSIDTTPTDYQAGLLLAALADDKHRIPRNANGRTLDLMHARQWIREYTADGRLATTVPDYPGFTHYRLSHHSINAANKAKAAREAAETTKAQQTLAARFPIDSAAVYLPDPTKDYRDTIIVKSPPAEDGKVDAISGRYNGKPIRVALDKLQPLPTLSPAAEGELTDWWTITDAKGKEITRVQAQDDPSARKAAMRKSSVRAVTRRDKGFAVRRLHTSELGPYQADPQEPVETSPRHNYNRP